MANKQVARMLVTHIFNITNRGKVVGGDIIEGRVEDHNYFEIIKNEEILRYKINSVEVFHTRDKGKIGFLIKSDGSDLTPLNSLNGQTIIINED